MTEFRNELLTRMIRLFGFENEYVITFAKACEGNNFTDDTLQKVVECYERLERGE